MYRVIQHFSTRFTPLKGSPLLGAERYRVAQDIISASSYEVLVTSVSYATDGLLMVSASAPLRENALTFFYSNVLQEVLPRELLEVICEPEKVYLLLVNGSWQKVLRGYAEDILQHSAVRLGSFLGDAAAMTASYPLVQIYFQKQLMAALRIAGFGLSLLMPSTLLTTTAAEKESVEFYNSVFHDKGAAYGVLAGGILPDLSYVFACSFSDFETLWKGTSSKRRIIKKFSFCFMCCITETVLSYGVRISGAKMGLRAARSRSLTTAAVFASQHLAVFFALPLIRQISTWAGVQVLTLVEQLQPSTPEDIEENAKEVNKEEEDAQAYMQLGSIASAGTDLYALLDVSRNATAAEIRQAYKSQSLRYHPDRAGRDAASQRNAQEKMAQINRAYEILSNADKRQVYDSRVDGNEPTVFGHTLDEVRARMDCVPSPILYVLGAVIPAAGILLIGYTHLSFMLKGVDVLNDYPLFLGCLMSICHCIGGIRLIQLAYIFFLCCSFAFKVFNILKLSVFREDNSEGTFLYI
eukprot:gene10471-7276_t